MGLQTRTHVLTHTHSAARPLTRTHTDRCTHSHLRPPSFSFSEINAVSPAFSATQRGARRVLVP